MEAPAIATNKRRPPLPADLKERSRDLRRNTTVPEQKLWAILRSRQLAGLKFRRQVVFGPFIVDFYCEAAKLVVEVDGESHVGQIEADERRAAYLTGRGLRVLRVTNDDVLRDIDAVAMAVVQAAGEDPHPPHPNSSCLRQPNRPSAPSPPGRGLG